MKQSKMRSWLVVIFGAAMCIFPIILQILILGNLYPDDQGGGVAGYLVVGSSFYSVLIVMITTVVGISVHKKVRKASVVGIGPIFGYLIVGGILSGLWLSYLALA